MVTTTIRGSDPGSAEEATGPLLPARRLERLIGRPAHEWTVDDLVDLTRRERVRIVSLMHVGGDGWLKTLDFVPRSDTHLRDVIEGGERADGSSIFAGSGIRPGASDILLRPRVGSAFLDPFADVPALVLLCSHTTRNGTPLPESPDTIVRAAAHRLRRQLGIELEALGEVEYFLGRHAREEDVDGADDRGYHASSPFVFGERLRRTAMTLLAEIGVPIKYGHAEVGHIPASEADDTIWEQHEIELALAPLAEAAEGVALTQWVLRNLAHRSGMRVRFDPIMRRGHAGSGLHFHLCPVIDGVPTGGRDAGGRWTDPGRWLVAGLVRYGGALMAFGNRVEGSFIRLGQGKEAPTSVAWGECDRHALIRIPIVATAPDGRMVGAPTIEFRLPDGSAHPFLLLAGIAQALVAARDERDLDRVLADTAATRVRAGAVGVAGLPRNSAEIATALDGMRAVLEAGGVFPAALLQGMIGALREGGAPS
ncbi:MAG: glutamine synthetase [Candidatus Eisenbacteria bacterium]